MMIFALKMTKLVSKMMNFVFNMINFQLKMMKFRLKMTYSDAAPVGGDADRLCGAISIEES